jgi:dTDP-4-amino-4,6-dideoxygalactose transaminase
VKIPLVDLTAQYAAIKAEVDAAISEVIGQTRFIVTGAEHPFERAFAEFCETRHAIGCSNGTAALYLALRAAGVEPGDDVVVPSMTFIATAEAVSLIGARPVFADVDADTGLLTAETAQAALTEKTRCVVGVHLYGSTCDWDSLGALASENGLVLVEDAAQAHGARYKGRRAGSLGVAASFSFYPGKNLGAYGDAGAVTTSEAEVDAFVRSVRDHGRMEKHAHGRVGFNFRMAGLQASVLGAKLPHLEDWNEARRQRAARYDALLEGLPLRQVTVPADCEPARHLYVTRSDRRDGLLAHLRERGVGAGVHYPVPVHLQGAYRDPELPEGSLPNTEALSREVISLPLYAELTELQQEQIAATVREFFENGP